MSSSKRLNERAREGEDLHDSDDEAAHRARHDRPAPRMATPARADRITVEGLLQWAQEGRIRMPSFQRSLRWGPEDKRKLLDSMERGYPIGTLLLWKRSATEAEIGAPLRKAKARPTSGDIYLVVDGQQRVATLWESLGLTPERGERAMVFDVQSESFQMRPLRRAEEEVPPDVTAKDPPPALPLSMVLDSTTLSEWVPAPLPREAKRRYFEVGKRLREYPIPIYIVEGDDMEVLRVVFDRINSTGRSLTRDEVFDALVGSRIVRGDESGFGLVDRQLDELGFGAIDHSTILKTFEAVSDQKIGKSNPRALDPKNAERDLLRTASALAKAITFLQSIGVPHIEVLPYELPLVVIARFFAVYDAPTERSLTLLRRWFWRASVAERLGGASGSLQQHVDDIQPRDEEASVQRLLDRTGQPEPPEMQGIAKEELSVATAKGKIVLCALYAHAPRSLVNGKKLAAKKLFAGGLNDALLRIVPPSSTRLGKSIANRLLHPSSGTPPSRLIRDSMDDGALASHGVDSATRSALRAEHPRAFLRRRSEVLDVWITQFINQRAEWGRDDAPSVAALASARVAS